LREGDFSMAEHWFEELASHDDPEAMFYLWRILDPYELSFDVPTATHRRARSFLERSAKTGYVPAS
jgi:TPR repeat protein